jgi:hypothetical protein
MHDIAKVTKIIAPGFTLTWNQATAPDDHQVLLFFSAPNRWFFGCLV